MINNNLEDKVYNSIDVEVIGKISKFHNIDSVYKLIYGDTFHPSFDTVTTIYMFLYDTLHNHKRY